ncbi:hypothetical protein BH11MYX3_BH11MYX3_08710 [soil metagenome]
MVRIASWFTLASLLASSAPASAKCAMSHLRPKVITTAPVASGGGILVATEQVSYDVSDRGDATQPTWRFAGTQTAPTIDIIAPGLAVYRLPAGARSVKLVAGKTTIATAATSTAKPATLAAPKVRSIRHDQSLGRRASAFTRVTLDGAVPAGMVALVLADAKGTPRSFGLIERDPAATEITVYAHSRCGVVPNNTIESSIGDKVTLMWVDQSGRVSPASKVVTVTGAKPTGDDE